MHKMTINILQLLKFHGRNDMLPQKGKKYYCYDDGKVSYGRQYEVLITDVIPWNDAAEELQHLCNQAIKQDPDLYKCNQDYIVIGVSYEQYLPTIEIFLETKYNGWFGIGDYNKKEQTFINYWNSGLLDVDNSLTENLKEKL